MIVRGDIKEAANGLEGRDRSDVNARLLTLIFLPPLSAGLGYCAPAQ